MFTVGAVACLYIGRAYYLHHCYTCKNNAQAGIGLNTEHGGGTHCFPHKRHRNIYRLITTNVHDNELSQFNLDCTPICGLQKNKVFQFYALRLLGYWSRLKWQVRFSRLSSFKYFYYWISTRFSNINLVWQDQCAMELSTVPVCFKSLSCNALQSHQAIAQKTGLQREGDMHAVPRYYHNNGTDGLSLEPSWNKPTSPLLSHLFACDQYFPVCMINVQYNSCISCLILLLECTSRRVCGLKEGVMELQGSGYWTPPPSPQASLVSDQYFSFNWTQTLFNLLLKRTF